MSQLLQSVCGQYFENGGKAFGHKNWGGKIAYLPPQFKNWGGIGRPCSIGSAVPVDSAGLKE